MSDVDIITMGCSKNLVDSERVMRMFSDEGFTVTHNPESITAPLVVINTCGFIGDAKQESIDMILECVEAKNRGQVSKIAVMGCLSQRYGGELPAELPEVDAWYGKFDWAKVAADFKKIMKPAHPWKRTLTTGPHHAYIKISEGCNRFCAFCAIPLITGRHHSRPVDEIVAEVKELVSQGVHEFNIIAQDLSSYGLDTAGRSQLAELLESLSDIDGVRWIRLHYAYPTQFPYDILPVMASRPNICKYLDIALQHIDNGVLSNMRRHITAEETRALLERIRREVPGIHIRTTLMTGFPGEDEAAFQRLMDFVREQRFDRMGAFAYCEEEDTYAAKHLEDSIPQEVKEERLDRLMALQEQISLELQEAKIGTEIAVVCDAREGDYWVCRTEFDSPEVDPVVMVYDPEATAMKPGEMYNVRITEAAPFELTGVLA